MRLVDVETMELHTAIHLTAEDARELKDSLQKMFDEAPTIDAVPVIHGHWVKEAKEWEWYYIIYYRCSNCENLSTRKTNFCPECGAMMDEND